MVTAAERLAAIRDRHLYDVDLGRWGQDEVGMLDALDAVLALCAEREAVYRRIFQTPAQLAAFGGSMPVVQVDADEVRAAITDALGGES